MNNILQLLFLFIFPLIVFAFEPIAEAEWPSNPEREKIREIVNEVDKLERTNELQLQSKQCRFGSEKFDEIGGALYKDRNGIVRKYILDREITSRSGIASYYYDAAGILRYTERFVGENYGLKNEERIFFNEKGKQLYFDKVERDNLGNIGEIPDALPDPEGHFSSICM